MTDEQEEEVEQQTRHEERAERGRGNRKGRGDSKSQLGVKKPPPKVENTWKRNYLLSGILSAAAWIRRFELETAGTRLCMADIHAVVARGLGMTEGEGVDRAARTEGKPDREPLDDHRGAWWRVLRDLQSGP